MHIAIASYCISLFAYAFLFAYDLNCIYVHLHVNKYLYMTICIAYQKNIALCGQPDRFCASEVKINLPEMYLCHLDQKKKSIKFGAQWIIYQVYNGYILGVYL